MARDQTPHDYGADDQPIPLQLAEDGSDEGAPPPEPRKKKSGSSIGLPVALFGGGLAIIALLMLVAYLRGLTPANVYLKARDNMRNKRFDRVWDVLDRDSREKYETWAASYGDKKVSNPALKSFSGMANSVTERSGWAETTVTVVSEEIDGDRATLAIEETKPGGRKSTFTVQLLKEEGRWKVDLTAMR